MRSILPRLSRRRNDPRSRPVEALELRLLLSAYTVADLNDAGPGSLRDAIQQANTAPGADTITFAGGLTGTISLSSGQLEVSDATGQTTIAAPAATITISGGNTRDLAVDPGAALSFSALRFVGADSSTIGGGVILNDGTLSADRCEFQGTESGGGGGGAIANEGQASFLNCAFSDDSATKNGGAIYNTGALALDQSSFSDRNIAGADGGSIFNDGGSVAITASSFAQTQAKQGGAIYNQAGTVSVISSTFNMQQASDSGGALVNYGTLTLTDSSVLRSVAGTNGSSVENGGTMFVSNSTFNLDGSIANSGALTIADSTIYQTGGITSAESAGNTTLYNSIVDSVSGPIDRQLAPGEPPSSHDLVVSGQAGGLTGGDGNLVGVDPELSALSFYGGRTETMIPKPGSPVIDAGSNALAATPAVSVSGDQRGFARIIDGVVDIGAVEVQPLVANSVPVFPEAAGQLGLEEALFAAMATNGTITFDPTVFSPGTLHTIQTHLSFLVQGDVAIDGPGAGVLALNFFEESSLGAERGNTLSLSGLALIGIPHYAINNEGVLNLSRCNLTGGSSALNDTSGTINASDCTFSGHPLALIGAALDNRGTANIANCTFTGNSSGYGGAINNSGTLDVIQSTFTGNSAPAPSGEGGAIFSSGTLRVSESTFTQNTADAGGAVFVSVRSTASASIGNSILAGNTAANGATPSDISGAVTGANNLIGTGGSGGLTDGVDGNIVGISDPKLAPLGDYGGPTMTMPPLPGSPAIDTGSNALIPAGVAADQRGDYRVFNGTVDIGAAESDSVPLLPGDANGDRKVDFADLLALAQNYQKMPATFTDGDFNADSSVGFDDLLILAQNYGQTAGGGAADDLSSTARAAQRHRPLNYRSAV